MKYSLIYSSGIEFFNRILLEKISDYNKSWGINLWKDTRNDLLILTRESLKKLKLTL